MEGQKAKGLWKEREPAKENTNKDSACLVDAKRIEEEKKVNLESHPLITYIWVQYLPHMVNTTFSYYNTYYTIS